MVDNRLSDLLMRDEPLLQCLGIVVRSVLSAAQTTLRANINWSNQIQNEVDPDLGAHFTFPAIQIVLIARKSVDEETWSVTACDHGLK